MKQRTRASCPCCNKKRARAECRHLGVTYCNRCFTKKTGRAAERGAWKRSRCLCSECIRLSVPVPRQAQYGDASCIVPGVGRLCWKHAKARKATRAIRGEDDGAFARKVNLATAAAERTTLEAVDEPAAGAAVSAEVASSSSRGAGEGGEANGSSSSSSISSSSAATASGGRSSSIRRRRSSSSSSSSSGSSSSSDSSSDSSNGSSSSNGKENRTTRASTKKAGGAARRKAEQVTTDAAFALALSETISERYSKRPRRQKLAPDDCGGPPQGHAPGLYHEGEEGGSSDDLCPICLDPLPGNAANKWEFPCMHSTCRSCFGELAAHSRVGAGRHTRRGVRVECPLCRRSTKARLCP